MIYKATNTTLKGIPRHGTKPLNFFTFYESKIGLIDGDENPTEQSLIGFRFHSSKAFANMSPKDHMKVHDIVHARVFIYEGIDKTEQELIDWALSTDQVANDSTTTILNAKEV